MLFLVLPVLTWLKSHCCSWLADFLKHCRTLRASLDTSCVFFFRQSGSQVLVRAQQAHLSRVEVGALRPDQGLRQVHLPRPESQTLVVKRKILVKCP